MSLVSFVRTLRTLGRGVAVGLPEAVEQRDPIELFREWLVAAERCGILEPTACTLATSTRSGAVSARTVLLKSVDESGFVFYTNYGSRKASQLSENGSAALVFHWRVLVRQVCIEGSAEKISREESEAYFKTRARGSQIGAWASSQSRPVASRDQLLKTYAAKEAEFEGRDVPLPPFWGGYRLHADRIEFWQGRPNRLHDRVLFTRDASLWKATRLNP